MLNRENFTVAMREAGYQWGADALESAYVGYIFAHGVGLADPLLRAMQDDGILKVAAPASEPEMYHCPCGGGSEQCPRINGTPLCDKNGD